MIVQIRIDRIDEIVELEDLCFSTDAWSREQIIDVLNDRRTIYLSYEENGKIIGEICLYNWCSEKDFLKIFSIATHPEHRNQGIAHELLKKSIKIASSNKLKRIKDLHLCVQIKNSKPTLDIPHVNGLLFLFYFNGFSNAILSSVFLI